MQLNIDLAIFIGFLIVNLGVGLYYGRGIKNLIEYAIGNRNFSTATITATIIATWIGGNFFTVHISEGYKTGLFYYFAGAGEAFSLLIIGYFIGPRLKEFFGQLSVAESMGKLYGEKVRVITAISSIAQAIGITAAQIKVFSTIFNHFLGISSVIATLISSFIVILYSAFGGIKAVTFTDVIQFITFGVFIPIFSLLVWQLIGDYSSISQIFVNNPEFDYHELFNIHNPKFLPYLFIFLWCLFPSLNSTMFQRTLMAKNTNQIRKSFSIAALICLCMHLFCCFTSLIVYSNDPDLEPNNIAIFIIDNYSLPGLKGFAIIGIMAMIMSTTDSWMNTGSVIFTHDFCKPLGIAVKNELLVSRLFVIFIGVSAIMLSLSSDNLLKLGLLTSNFYRPIVTVPLILAIFGFRSSTKVVLIGMISGIFTILVWRTYIQPGTGIDSVMPAMFANLIAFTFAHCLLKKKSKIRNKNVLSVEKIEIRRMDKKYTINTFFADLLKNISSFSLLEYCRRNSPKQEATYVFFSLFSLASILIFIFFFDHITHRKHLYLVTFTQVVGLVISTAFFCHKLWPDNFSEKYTGLIWHISLFINLAFISSFMVLMNKFSQLTLVIFILNLTIISVLLNWKSALLTMLIGTSAAFSFYQFYIGEPSIENDILSLKLKIIYVLFMISSFMLAFLKPKQEYQVLTEEKNEHLNGRIDAKEKELQKALSLKSEFIRNISHEYHAPMTGVMSTSEILWEKYDTLPDKQRKQAAYDIFTSSLRLKAFDDNIVSLSKLSKVGYELKIEPINLSDLLYDRIQTCRKLYEEDKESREFTLNIEVGITINGDSYYLTQALDNLIVNTINYCQKGKITIDLRRTNNKIHLNISDEGIGIPPDELFAIFEEFTVSSKTRTPAGGRGIGLSVVKKVIEAHKGSIKAESDGIKGTTFRLVFPTNHI